MLINDTIYGEYKLEPVLEALIYSDAVQRLKGVHQGGAGFLVNPKWNGTRYDHSIGVMLLIKELGGSLEEQIAGLLHDVSHTAFSHVVDGALSLHEENYHERIYEKMVHQSDISAVLNKFGYDLSILTDHSKWILLEREAPHLCADRVDYTLRDLYTYGMISMTEVEQFLSELTTHNGCMVLKNIETAEWFTKAYYMEVIDFFMNPLNVYANHKFATVIKEALQADVIDLEVLMLSDKEVLERLYDSQHQPVMQILNTLHQNVKVKENNERYDIYAKNKVRLIDPSVLINGEVFQASTLSAKVRGMNDEAEEEMKRGRFVQIMGGLR